MEKWFEAYGYEILLIGELHNVWVRYHPWEFLCQTQDEEDLLVRTLGEFQEWAPVSHHC